MATTQTGGNVDAWCGKCSLMLAHTVEAMVDGNIKRVHCNTCKSQHAYKGYAPGEAPPAAERAPRASKPRAASKKPSAGTLKASDYDNYMKGRDPNDARRYSPKVRFNAGEVIDHPKFGTGVAVAIKDGDKLDVLFPDGPRTLIHGR